MRAPFALGLFALALSACFATVKGEGTTEEDTTGGPDEGSGSGGSVSSTSGGSGGSGSASGGTTSGGTTSGTTTSGSSTDGTSDSGSSSGGDGGWADCELPTECVLAADDCCGVCGEPSAADMDGVNAERLEEHQAEVCPDPDSVPCPGCPSAINASLVATCHDGTCTPVDLEGPPWAMPCTKQDDCVLRSPTCCEPCGEIDPWTLVAVHRDQLDDVRDVLCDPMSGCPACAPMYPMDVIAFCDDQGYCAIQRP